MNIKFNQFSGIIPRISNRLLPETNATIAKNVDLLSKNINTLNSSLEIKTLADSSQVSLYLYNPVAPNGEIWLTWPYDTDIVKHPSPEDPYNRIYYTGNPDKKLHCIMGAIENVVTSSDVHEVVTPTSPITIAHTELFDPSLTTVSWSGYASNSKTLTLKTFSKSSNTFNYTWILPSGKELISGTPNTPIVITHIDQMGDIITEVNCEFLAHFDNNLNDSSSFTRTITLNTGTTLSATHSKFGIGALYVVTSVGATVNIPAIGTGDFSFDFWAGHVITGTVPSGLFRLKTISGTPILDVSTSITINGTTFSCFGGLGNVYFCANTNQWWNGSAFLTIDRTNEFVHYCLDRKSGTVRLFINGELIGQQVDNSSIPASVLYIGNGNDFNTNGYIDEFAVFNKSKHDMAFTPPTASYTGTGDGYIYDIISDTTQIARINTNGSIGSVSSSTYTQSNSIYVTTESDRIYEMSDPAFKITIINGDIISTHEIHVPYLEAGHGLQSFFDGILIALNSSIPGGGFSGTCAHDASDFTLTYIDGIISFASPSSGYDLYAGEYMHLNIATFNSPQTYAIWSETEFTTAIDMTYEFKEGDISYVMTYVNDLGEEGDVSPISAQITRTEVTRVVLTLPISDNAIIETKKIYRRTFSNNQFAFYLVAEVANATATYVDWIKDSALDLTKFKGKVEDRTTIIDKPSTAITITSSDLFNPSLTTCTWSGSEFTTRVLALKSQVKGEDGYSFTYSFPATWDLITTAAPTTPIQTVNIPVVGNVTNANIGIYYPLTSDTVKYADIKFLGVLGTNTYNIGVAYGLINAEVTGSTTPAISNGSFKATMLTNTGSVTFNVNGITCGSGTSLADFCTLVTTRVNAATGSLYGFLCEVEGTTTVKMITSSGGFIAFSTPDSGYNLYTGGYLDLAAISIWSSERTYVLWDQTEFVASIKMNNEFSDEEIYYIMTYVNDLEEESPPSPISALVDRTATTRMTLTLPVSSNSHIIKKRIYRSTTGVSTAGFYFVTEVTNATTSYVDWIKTSALEEKLIVREDAPDGLLGIVMMPNGFAAAFKGREVWFSDSFYISSWLAENTITIDYDIIGLAVSGNDLVVMTTGTPSLITGDAPEDMRQSKIAFPQGCVSKRSIAQMDNMVLYASPDGIVQIRGGQATLITISYFTRKNWQALIPASSIATVHDNRYHFHCTGGSYLFDMTAPETGMLITTYDTASAQGMYSDIEYDKLYYIEGNKIYSWNTGSTVQLGTWRSKYFLFDRPQVFTSMQVTARSYNHIWVRAWADDVLVFDRYMYDEYSVRIPAGRPAREWFVEIETMDTIDDVQISSSMITMQ